MTEKLFFIEDGLSAVVGIYYQGEKNKLTIGGNCRFHYVMNCLIEEYFMIKKFRRNQTASNKEKFVMKITDEKYQSGIKKMKKDHMVLQITKNFNRIWW